MSATPAFDVIARETSLKLRSRSKTSVTSEMRSTNTNERSLRKLSCSACSTDRKKTDALVTDVDTSQSTYSSGRSWATERAVWTAVAGRHVRVEWPGVRTARTRPRGAAP